MKKRMSVIVLALLISMSMLSPVFATETITKTYKFNPESKNDMSYNPSQEIKKRDKTYILDENTEIKYKLLNDNKVKVKKTVTVKNKEDIDKEIKHKTDSGYVILKLKEGDEGIEWKSIYRSPKVMTKDYATVSEIPSNLSNKVEENGKILNITCDRTDIKKSSKTVDFSAPAKFYGYPDSSIYSFNGKKVKITGNKPVWNGYKDDVANYLGDKGKYNVTGARWSSNMKPYQDMYVRQARFTGTKVVPYYQATFVESNDTRSMYEAVVTYEGIDTNKQLEAEATVTYKIVDTGLTTLQKVLIAAAGVMVLIAVIILILFILKKKERREC